MSDPIDVKTHSFLSPTQFWVWIFFILIIKICVMLSLPIQGDEAYYFQWGQQWRGGFYDLPPMVGWLTYFQRFFSNHLFSFRFPVFVFSILMLLGFYKILVKHGKERARLGTLIFALVPLFSLPMVVSTDAPLIFFFFFSVLFFHFSLERKNYFLALVAGVFGGLAFLSKYFALFLLPTVFLHIIFEKNKRIFFLIYCVGYFPFIYQHIDWNLDHCLINYTFNFKTRHDDSSGFNFERFFSWVGFHFYLATPPLIYLFLKSRLKLREIFTIPLNRIIFFSFILPIIPFGLSALKQGQGIHWLLFYYPFFFLMVGLFFSKEQLFKNLKWIKVFYLVHIISYGVIVFLPDNFWKEKLSENRYRDYLLMRYPREVGKFINFKGPIVAENYTTAALLTYGLRDYPVAVFKNESRFGRNDDLVTDYQLFDNQDILIFTRFDTNLDKFEPYFNQLKTKRFQLRGTDFVYVVGSNFNAKKYIHYFKAKMVEKYFPKSPYERNCSIR